MINLLIIGIFILLLISCLAFHLPLLVALGCGYLLFAIFALYKDLPIPEIIRISLKGLQTVKEILFLFLYIGILTAFWRSSGTMPYIVSYAVDYIHPTIAIVLCFIFNALLSFFTGTSFGTVAIMGFICISITNAMHISPLLSGGAILSGIFFGDRCSPLSTSAILVSEITRTNLYKNVKLMQTTAFIPLMITLIVYTALGFLIPTTATHTIHVRPIFEQEFNFTPWLLLPVIAMLLLSLFRVKVKTTMLTSILLSAFLSYYIQGHSLMELADYGIFGYHSSYPRVEELLHGGGILSMIEVIGIVLISSAYTGIFERTQLLYGLISFIEKTSHRFTSFGGVLLTATLTSLISCSQTLAIILTEQICKHIEPDQQKLAIQIENTASLIPALIPWSIACSVPLATISAPWESIFAAVFLYIVPLWNWLMALRAKP